MAARKVFGSLAGWSIPLRLEKAVDDDNPGTYVVCVGTEEKPHPPTRVKQHIDCPHEGCGKTASSYYGFPERGAENGQGELVVLDSKAIAEAKGAPITGKIDCPFMLRFHQREKVFASTMYFGSVNNLSPAPGGEEPYAYLYNFLATNPDMVAAFTWAPKSRNAHWVIEAAGDGRLVAYALAFPESVRPVAQVAQLVLDPKRVAMFEKAAELETVDFNPADYSNQAKAGVQSLIDQANGVPMPSASGVTTGGDMWAALQASVDAAKPNTRKKAPAKKAAVRKAPAKKVTVKKAATRRPARKAS